VTYLMPITVRRQSDSKYRRPSLKQIVDSAPNPRHKTLVAWLEFAEASPDILRRLERPLKTDPRRFSFDGLRVGVRVTPRPIPATFRGLYARALIMRNPHLNGYFLLMPSHINSVLGCSLALERIGGEPFRRLVW